MKKTITANIGGINFHLDEDAFQRFSTYLESIRASLKYTEGVEETMQDIEGRIAEILQERNIVSNKVADIEVVEYVIGQMGKPEDFAGSAPGQPGAQPERSYSIGRKMFRDPDDKVLGGVCSGLGAYFSIDTVWIRLAFAILFFGFGTGFMLYLILWLVIPKARTASDKLRMKGEPINVANIEKNIREEMEDLEKRTRKGGRTFGPFLSRLLEGVGEILKNILKAFVKLFAFIFVFFGIIMSLVVFAVLFSLTTNSNGINLPLDIRSFFTNQGTYLMTLLGTALAIGIPFLALGLFGLKHLLKSKLPKFTNWALFALWFVGIIMIIIGLSDVI
ncbi:MAG: PspC domain-containing protein, partial [Bacteroidota bacterium]